jgi:drug/metabolite transporter (DMT)-like permease
MLVVMAAVGAAVAINAGYVVQHAGLATAPRIELRRPVAAVAALVRSRRWLAGALLGYAGLGLEVVALTALPLSAVQATIGAGLVIVAVLSRAVGGAPLGRAAPAGAALAIAALVLIALVTPGPVAGRPAPSPWELAAAAAIVTGAAALAARRLPTAAGLALAAGLLYGMTSVAMAVLAPVLAGNPPPLTVAAAAIAIGAPVTAAGFLCFQRALQRGRPLPVVTVMMAAMDVAAAGGGIVVLGDPLAPGAGARAAQLTALALAALSAVVVLAGRRGEPQAAEELPGLVRRRDPEVRPAVGRIGARPGVGAALEAQVGDGRAAPAAHPVEA